MTNILFFSLSIIVLFLSNTSDTLGQSVSLCVASLNNQRFSFALVQQYILSLVGWFCYLFNDVMF